MRAPGLPVIAVAVLVPLTACDLTQKPQTLALRAGIPVEVVPQQDVSAPIVPETLQAPGEPYGGAAVGTDVGSERSIRLQGPGVSRKRQTRV